ncbi:MAG: hypothetical protein ABIQ53_06035 [Terracoccus sp.]
MFTTLIAETGSGHGFPVQGLITLVVAAAVFYPVQKKVREVASRRRRERWAQEGLLTPEELHGGDEVGPGEPGPDSPGVSNPTQQQSPRDDRSA